MSTPNPYAAPKAPVADAALALPENFHPGGQARPAGRGWGWIAEGWRLFTKAPGMWIGITVVAALIMIVLAFIPFLGGLAMSLLAPVFAGGVMLGCRALDEERQLELGHLFAGFQTQLGSLVAVGAIYLGLSLAVMLVVMAVTGASMFGMFSGGGPGAQNPETMMAMLASMGLAMLVGLALFVPVMMAMWFAAPLVVFNRLGAVDAMKQSFGGCLKNVVPFLIYGIVMLVLAIIASVPIGLGWLVLGPVTAASIYTSYRDIYLD
jgi:uncharacterized membrane protein